MLLNLIKIISVFLTALFGVLGTFKDFSKDKNSRRWQIITIAGIMTSAVIGIVTQNMEYRNNKRAQDKSDQDVAQTTSNLIKLGNDLKDVSGTLADNFKATKAANGVLEVQLRNEADFAKDQKIVLQQQSVAVATQNENVSSLTRILNPVTPVGLDLDVDVQEIRDTPLTGDPVRDQPCLIPYFNSLRNLIPPDHPSFLEISSSDPLAPATKSRVYPLKTLIASLSFKKTGYEPIVYELRPAQDRVQDEEVERFFNYLLSKDFERIRINFGLRKSVIPSASIHRISLNLRPNETEKQTFLSVRDFIGSEMVVSLRFEESNANCNISAELKNFGFLWGQSYSSGTTIDVKKFTVKKVVNENPYAHEVTYTYHPTAADFGFSRAGYNSLK